MILDLDDGERAAPCSSQGQALVVLLRRALDDARYPLASRWARLKAVLAKLEPPAPAELPPPIRSGLTPRVGRGRCR